MTEETTETLARFTLRLPRALYRKLAALAAREQRSLHGQVIYLLWQAVGGEG